MNDFNKLDIVLVCKSEFFFLDLIEFYTQSNDKTNEKLDSTAKYVLIKEVKSKEVFPNSLENISISRGSCRSDSQTEKNAERTYDINRKRKNKG